MNYRKKAEELDEARTALWMTWFNAWPQLNDFQMLAVLVGLGRHQLRSGDRLIERVEARERLLG